MSAQIAENSVVREPRHNIRVSTRLLFEIRGWNRIRRKIPATTIVLECSRAETGVGPSMADGSHGCSPNWADFPVAAIKSPRRGKVLWLLLDKICWSSQEFVFRKNHIIAIIRPTSPIRLYRIA